MEDFFVMALMWLLALAVLIATIIFGISVFYGVKSNKELFVKLLAKQFPSLVLLPFAITGSTILVTLINYSTKADIELSLTGVTLSGPASQSVMWLACFLSMVFAIKLLWDYSWLDGVEIDKFFPDHTKKISSAADE